MIQEPVSLCVGHVTPNSGSSEDIVKSVISHLSERGISLENLILIGCDCTATTMPVVTVITHHVIGLTMVHFDLTLFSPNLYLKSLPVH